VTTGAYVTTDGDGAHDIMVRQGNDWLWIDGASQTRETYEFANGSSVIWRLKSVTDLDGNAVNVSYLAGSDRVETVTTADGSYTLYGWSGNNITRIATVVGGVTTARTHYIYDGQNRLSKVQVELSPNDNAVADGALYEVTYGYVGTSKLINSITQSDGSSLAIAYDGSNRVTSVTQTVAAGDVRVTSFAYAATQTTITQPDGQVTLMDYDASKRLTKITAPPAVAGAAAQTVLFVYDTNDNLASVTDANGKVTSYGYTESYLDPGVTTPANQSGTNDAKGNV
ncbi:hypothetical protein ACFOWX_00060, partial [Sphingorhabdus arenilitoris]